MCVLREPMTPKRSVLRDKLGREIKIAQYKFVSTQASVESTRLSLTGVVWLESESSERDRESPFIPPERVDG
jgi:hypothetical protein